MKKKIWMTMILAVSLTAWSQAAMAKKEGNEGSGGGDMRAAQFKSVGKAIAAYLRAAKTLPADLERLDPKKLDEAAVSVEVASTNETLYLDGITASAVIKDAINNPGRKVIVFNREAWDLVADGSHRAALVLHEYLRFLGFDDSQYQISEFLYEDLSARAYFNNVSQTQSLTQGIELDFTIKCVFDYNGRRIDELDPIGVRVSRDGRSSVRTAMIGREFGGSSRGEILQILIYNKGDEIVAPLLPYKKGEGLLSFNLGVGPTSFMSLPQKMIWQQDVRITPNFYLEMSFPEHKLQMSCRRLVESELAQEPFFVPVFHGSR